MKTKMNNKRKRESKAKRAGKERLNGRYCDIDCGLRVSCVRSSVSWSSLVIIRGFAEKVKPWVVWGLAGCEKGGVWADRTGFLWVLLRAYQRGWGYASPLDLATASAGVACPGYFPALTTFKEALSGLTLADPGLMGTGADGRPALPPTTPYHPRKHHTACNITYNCTNIHWYFRASISGKSDLIDNLKGFKGMMARAVAAGAPLNTVSLFNRIIHLFSRCI